MKLKADFAQIHKKIQLFMEYYSDKELNKLMIFDDGQAFEVYSDIIYITDEIKP